MKKTYLFKKILIIEDEDIFLKPLSKFLTMNQFQVNIAKNALTGIDLQDNINFDLIITDLRLEGINGLQAINAIIANYPDAKIIVISGYLKEDSEFNEIRSNPHVNAIFEKPVDFNILLERIKEILQ